MLVSQLEGNIWNPFHLDDNDDDDDNIQETKDQHDNNDDNHGDWQKLLWINLNGSFGPDKSWVAQLNGSSVDWKQTIFCIFHGHLHKSKNT